MTGFAVRNDFDLSDLKNINANLDIINPNLIINCAAFTSVDNVEYDFESAILLIIGRLNLFQNGVTIIIAGLYIFPLIMFMTKTYRCQ